MVPNLEAVWQMTGKELVNLAQTLGIPLTSRKYERNVLISKIMEELVPIVEEYSKKKEELHTPAIKISDLVKKFGKTLAVEGLNLVVNPGEIVGLVGPNGAGKTTTLRALTGIIQPTKGTIIVNGYNMAYQPVKAKYRLGYIPERPTCYPSLKVREYLTFIARVYGIPKEIALVRIREMVELFQLDPFLDMYIGNLSKGNLQRTLLIGIFIREPPFILAFDEPIYGLDPRGAWSLKKHIRDLRDTGSAILISTHILEVAQSLCDRFVIMNEGNVVGEGSLEELLEKCPAAKSLEEVFLELTGGIPEEQ